MISQCGFSHCFTGTLNLLSLPFVHKDTCDYISLPQIIQDHLLLLRSCTIHICKVPFACKVTYSWFLEIGTWTYLGEAEGHYSAYHKCVQRQRKQAATTRSTGNWGWLSSPWRWGQHRLTSRAEMEGLDEPDHWVGRGCRSFQSFKEITPPQQQSNKQNLPKGINERISMDGGLEKNISCRNRHRESSAPTPRAWIS